MYIMDFLQGQRPYVFLIINEFFINQGNHTSNLHLAGFDCSVKCIVVSDSGVLIDGLKSVYF